MARKFASRAEELRHHRKCFELALEMGCTPKEAELWLEATEQRERHRARMARAGLKTALPPIEKPQPDQRNFERWDAPHMMRD